MYITQLQSRMRGSRDKIKMSWLFVRVVSSDSSSSTIKWEGSPQSPGPTATNVRRMMIIIILQKKCLGRGAATTKRTFNSYPLNFLPPPPSSCETKSIDGVIISRRRRVSAAAGRQRTCTFFFSNDANEEIDPCESVEGSSGQYFRIHVHR